MDEINSTTQSVLRCERCNKPFDKPSTLKRHGYYCRSRRAGKTSRPRSCISCAKGKARCDIRRPKCLRCTTKSIECHYPANPPKNAGPRVYSDDATPSPVMEHSSPNNRHETSNINPGSPFVGLDLNFANLGREYFDWVNSDVGFPGMNLADYSSPQTNEKPVRYPFLWSSSLTQQPTDRMVQAQQDIFPQNIPIPKLLTLRSLVQRPNLKAGERRIANLILHTLKSYPLMMRRNDTLPPFIHPCLVSSDVKNNDMEPLMNCISLIHMVSSGVQWSRKLFWKTVQLECERFRDEHLMFNKWELLAAMQALALYMFIRLGEGETEHNNFDFLLLEGLVVVSKQLASNDTQSSFGNSGFTMSWKDWIFKESMRRICVVYRIINLIVLFEPAGLCNLQKDLVIAPLPAKKQLWGAGDDYMWKLESQSEIEATFGLAANGELVRLSEDELGCGEEMPLQQSASNSAHATHTANWEEWCSGMDEFGGLVMLAASLVA